MIACPACGATGAKIRIVRHTTIEEVFKQRAGGGCRRMRAPPNTEQFNALCSECISEHALTAKQARAALAGVMHGA